MSMWRKTLATGSCWVLLWKAALCLFCMLPISAWSPLLIPWLLPTAWWCIILTLCINPLSAFQVLPEYRTTAITPISCCQRQGEDQCWENTLHWGASISYPWDATLQPSWSPAIHQSLLQSWWCQLGISLMSFGVCYLPAWRSLNVF